jgi:hypothetical protein
MSGSVDTMLRVFSPLVVGALRQSNAVGADV